MRKIIFKVLIMVLFILINIPNASGRILGNDDTYYTESNSSIRYRHKFLGNEHVSSETKSAAKIAACATVAKGICLGVDGVRYIKNGVNESSGKQTPTNGD